MARTPIVVPVLLLLAACARGDRAPPPVPAPPAPAAGNSARAPATTPRWQPVPVKADGAVVPGGRRHIVKPGETGLAIAAAYKVSWRRIATANGIGFDSVIRVGQPLFIPDDAVAASTLPPARKPARAPAGSAGTAPPRPSAQPAAAPDPEAMARAFSLNIDDLVSGSAVAAPARAPSARSAPPGSPATVPATVPVTAVPRLAWPVDGRVILSGFGPKPGGKVNEGVTIKAQKGAAVRAAAPGTVLYVGDAIPSFGLLVLVRHDNGVITAYGHLEDALVDKGQALDRGAILGRAGTSGQASEPSVMFQLRLGRKPVDPMPFLRAQA